MLSLFCCGTSNYINNEMGNCVFDQKQLDQLQKHARCARDAKITAFALAMITLFLFSLSFVLYGLGTLSPTALMGFGPFPYLGGIFFTFLGLGVLSGSLIFASVYRVRSCQIARLEVRLREVA